MMKNDIPLISVIIVNYNGLHFLKEMMPTLMNQSLQDFEVILIDNASKDGSLEYLESCYPHVHLIKNSENFGFTANNQGMKIARGKYVVLINNDTILDHNFLCELVKPADVNPQVGMVAPKVLITDKPELIDSVGMNIYPDGMSRQRGRLEESIKYTKEEEIFVPSGCAGLYRKEMLGEIGYFDEDFFAYCEDTDLGMRGRIAGWKAELCPNALIYHYGSGSSGKFSPFKAFLVERNHFWVAIKNFPISVLIFLPFYTAYRYLVQIYGLVFRKGIGGQFIVEQSSFELLKILFRAYYSALSKLVPMIKKRNEVFKMRKVPIKEIRGWFKRFRASIKSIILTN